MTTTVLLAAPSLGGGGAERQMLRLANHLDRDRFRVTVAVARGAGSYEAYLANDVDIHQVAPWRLPSDTSTVLSSVPGLRRLIERQRPDVVCSFLDHVTVATGLACWRMEAKPKHVVVVQNTPSQVRRHGSRARRATLLAAARIMQRADQVVALSHGVAADVAESLGVEPSEIQVVYNAGFDERASILATEPVGTEPERPLVVACGRLVAQKGFRYLIEAISRARDRIALTAWIVGDGPERANLERQISSLGLAGTVHLLGHVENPYKYMATADLFVLPSLFEGFANVVTEAMSVGAAVLASDCPHGPREILGDSGRYGVLVPPADPSALAHAILDLLTSDERRAALAKSGRQRAMEFDAVTSAAGYGAVFESVAGLRDP